MNGYALRFRGADLVALATGALWWKHAALLVVSDLHLGKSERLVRRGGPMLPPYETQETLGRLEADIRATAPTTVICLGDSFDDRAAAGALDAESRARIATLQAGRRWIWIEGNHEAGPVDMAGTHLHTHHVPPLIFRHIAAPDACGEVSGHYHPKARLVVRGRTITRPCFLHDAARLILPAYGAYTGGLHADSAVLDRLMAPDARAILTGRPTVAIPMPRRQAVARG